MLDVRLFYAQRHAEWSTFRLRTNIDLVTSSLPRSISYAFD